MTFSVKTIKAPALHGQIEFWKEIITRYGFPYRYSTNKKGMVFLTDIAQTKQDMASLQIDRIKTNCRYRKKINQNGVKPKWSALVPIHFYAITSILASI
jgi:hypothetical protein